MKKIFCMLLAVLLIVLVGLVCSACGEDKKVDDLKTNTEPTQAAVATQASITEAPTQAVPSAEASAAAETVQQESAYPVDVYGGITSVEAVEKALAYTGAGYEVVSNEQRYFRNNEAWYVGVKAFVEDANIYYLYVNKDQVVPQTEIPDRSNGQSGVYGDLTLDQAMQSAVSYMGDGWSMVSSEQRYLRNQEAWYIGTSKDGGDGTIYYLYVNSSGVVPQEDIPR